jgi:hypothetical protein
VAIAVRWRGGAGAWLGRAGLVALLWLLGGRAGLLLGLVIVVIELPRPLAPRRLIAAGLVLLVALPLVVVARGLPTRATLSPDFASSSLVPHLLAGAGLALLVLGVLRDVRASLPPEPAGEQGPRAIGPPPARELERGPDERDGAEQA